MIRKTHELNPQGTIVAYSDNAAIMEGRTAHRFYPDALGRYGAREELTHTVMKCETHNHPTAISPFPGAATGSGGEIRDEGATGRGARPKAGLCGFSVSHLRIPGFEQPWEKTEGKPSRIASSLAIMLEGPIGAASFNNEFGRPNLAGYFRAFEAKLGGTVRGYHKPIMIAGGIGNINAMHSAKDPLPEGALLIQLGGPGMLIGMGGGAASSMDTGANTEDLDFDSVQRGNAEIQRRAQEVIDRCWQLGGDNPILSIHDVGAGGVSNALPEIVHGADRGARIDLRAAPSEEPGMSPREIWCNEAQERYVLAIAPSSLPQFEAICARERCPFAVVGTASAERRLRVEDPHFGNVPVDMDLGVLLGKPPRMTRDVRHLSAVLDPLSFDGMELKEACYRVLRAPTVANKTFLVSIGDRTVGGLCARDPFVGPWQVPAADCAVTLLDFSGCAGEAYSIGERAPLAVIDAAASGRMAVGEALTNLAAARSALARVVSVTGWRPAAIPRTRPVRYGARSGDRSVSARQLDPRRQGFAVHAHGVAGRKGHARGGIAAVAHRLGLRALRGCARYADAAATHRLRTERTRADRSRARPQPSRRLDPGTGIRALWRPGARSRGARGAGVLFRLHPGARPRRSAARLS
jgi:phosphoribosylformylglycinamidine synthase